MKLRKRYRRVRLAQGRELRHAVNCWLSNPQYGLRVRTIYRKGGRP